MWDLFSVLLLGGLILGDVPPGPTPLPVSRQCVVSGRTGTCPAPATDQPTDTGSATPSGDGLRTSSPRPDRLGEIRRLGQQLKCLRAIYCEALRDGEWVGVPCCD